MEMEKNWIKKFFFLLVIFGISAVTFITVFAQDQETLTNPSLINFEAKKLKNIVLNKVIIVGDSRMEYLLKDESVKKPVNFTFDAKSGADFSWFKKIGESKLIDILDNRDLNYHYHVVFNLGVNDIQFTKDIEQVASNYIKEYEKIIRKYQNIDFYFLSVNPIDENVINNHFNSNIRTNKNIVKLNAAFKDSTDEFSNYRYCDSYNSLDFKTYDGLHYKNSTNQDIIDYIARSCVQYK